MSTANYTLQWGLSLSACLLLQFPFICIFFSVSVSASVNTTRFLFFISFWFYLRCALFIREQPNPLQCLLLNSPLTCQTNTQTCVQQHALSVNWLWQDRISFWPCFEFLFYWFVSEKIIIHRAQRSTWWGRKCMKYLFKSLHRIYINHKRVNLYFTHENDMS